MKYLTREDRELAKELIYAFKTLQRDLTVYGRAKEYTHVANSIAEIVNGDTHYQVQIHLVSRKENWMDSNAVFYIIDEKPLDIKVLK